MTASHLNAHESRWKQIGRVVACLGLAGVSACAAQAGIEPPPPPPPPPGVCSVSTAPLAASDATVTIDVSRTYQIVQGFGTSEHLFDDPHITNTFDPATQRAAVVIPASAQAAILKALYTDIGLTRVRYATENGVEPVNDNADPTVTDPAKFNFAWKLLDGHAAFVQSVRPLGVTTWYGAPIYPETWMSRTDPAEYAEWALASLRRWRDLGQTMPYWSISNEPGWQGGGTTMSGAFLRDAIKIIGPKLAAEGIATRLVIPDDVNPTESFNRAQVVLADPIARSYVAAVAFHLYDAAYPPVQPNFTGLSALAGLAAQNALPLWMSEWYTTDWFTLATTMHTLLNDYSVSAIDYAWGFFGAWDLAQLISIQSSGNVYTGFIPRKQYYVMGQYSANVRPGTPRVAASVASDPAVRVSAYFDGTRVVLVALNTGPAARSVRFELGQNIPCVRTVHATRTSAAENGAPLPDLGLAAPHFVTSLPAMSITTLIAQ